MAEKKTKTKAKKDYDRWGKTLVKVTKRPNNKKKGK